MKKTKLILSVILLASCTINAGGGAYDEDLETERVLLESKIDQQIADRGGDVNAGEGNELRTLLMSYASEGILPAVRYLVEQKGADVNVEDTYYGPGKQGRTALIFPAYFGHADIVEYFASDRFPKMDTTLARTWANGNHQDAEKASRIIAALNRIDAKTALQRPSARGGQAAQLSEEEQMALAIANSLADPTLKPSARGGQAAPKRMYQENLSEMQKQQQLQNLSDEEILKLIEKQTADDEAAVLQREEQARQGNFFQELSAPQELQVDGKNYTIRQIFALRQGKVSGRLEKGKPDETCFAQATKNSKAIIEFNQEGRDELLAPLVILEEAREKLGLINGKLWNTGDPEFGDSETQPDQSDGNWDNVSLEFGSKMIVENWDLRENLIVLSDDGIQALIRPKNATERKDALTQLRENGGKLFFAQNQISGNTLDVIDRWRMREIMDIGIILRKKHHFISIVFNQRDPQNIQVLVADSIKGNYVNDREMTQNIYLPLIQLLQKTDLTDWLRALREGRQTKNEEGGDFSLFD